jgi:murein DD-endopeptidase MepM/ murein hydrolase activator NlpD
MHGTNEWEVIGGYNGGKDHFRSQQFGLDFATSKTSQVVGQPVYAPVSGKINWMDPNWPAKGKPPWWQKARANCMSIRAEQGANVYLAICHVQFLKPYKRGDPVTQGMQIGTVGAEDEKSDGAHIHIHLYTAATDTAGEPSRSPLSFEGDWSIAGCAYNKATGGVNQYAGTTGLPRACPTRR